MDRARDSGDVSSAHPILEDGLDILIELVPTLEQKELRGKFSNIAAYQAKVLHSSSSDNDGLTLNDIDVLFQFVAQTLIDPSEGGKADTISGMLRFLNADKNAGKVFWRILNFYSFEGDKYTELMGLLREQKKFAIPSARGILQGLIGAVQDLKRAKNEKDPDAAKEILKSVSNILEELLPKLRGGKFYQFYSNTLTKNLHLNQKIASYYGNSVFDYTDTYIEEITAELGRLLSE